MAENKKTAPKEQETYEQNPMKRMKTVFLPPATGKEPNSIFVGLNGKSYNIMRGRPVQVPEPVYQIVKEKERLEGKARDYYDTISANAGAAALK